MLEWQPEPVDALVSHGLLYRQTKMLLYGRWKSFKSIVAMNLAMSLAKGEKWLDFDVMPSSVLYLQLEGSEKLLQKRVIKLAFGRSNGAEAHKTQKPISFWYEPFIKLDTPQGLSVLEGKLAKTKPEVLIIDPLYKVLSGDMLSPNSVRDFTDQLDIMSERHQLTIILAHHSRKRSGDMLVMDEETGSDDMMGAAVLSYWADSVVKVIRKGGKNKNEVKVSFEALRHAEEDVSLREAELSLDTLCLSMKNYLKL